MKLWLDTSIDALEKRIAVVGFVPSDRDYELLFTLRDSRAKILGKPAQHGMQPFDMGRILRAWRSDLQRSATKDNYAATCADVKNINWLLVAFTPTVEGGRGQTQVGCFN